MKQILFPGRFWLYAIVALWGFLGLGAGLWLVIGCLKFWGLASDAAAWVQAVGSVVAILAAIGIAEQAHRRDIAKADRSELLEQVRVAWLAECSVYEAYKAIFNIREQVEVNQHLLKGPVVLVRLEKAIDTMSSVLLMTLPHRLVNTLSTAIGDAAEIQVAASGWTVMTLPSDWEVRLKAAAGALNAERVTIEIEYRRLGRIAKVPTTTRVVQ